MRYSTRIMYLYGSCYTSLTGPKLDVTLRQASLACVPSVLVRYFYNLLTTCLRNNSLLSPPCNTQIPHTLPIPLPPQTTIHKIYFILQPTNIKFVFYSTP